MKEKQKKKLVLLQKFSFNKLFSLRYSSTFVFYIFSVSGGELQHRPCWANKRQSYTQKNTFTMRNLYISYKSLFAGKFVWDSSQVSNASHDGIPVCCQLVGVIQIPNNI